MVPPLLEVGIALTALAAAGTLAIRYGFSVVPAYIVVGIVIGPSTPQSLLGVPVTIVENRELIQVLSQLGVIFLLFFLGLEFSVTQLLADRRRITAIGTIDFVVNFGVGLALGALLGWTFVETLFLAGVVYTTSSAVVTKSIVDAGWIADPESVPILGTLVFEDILIAVYLAILGALVVGGDVQTAALSVLTAAVFLGALTVVAWYGVTWLDRLFGTTSNELFLLRIVGATTLVAGAALVVGVSEPVAAFFLGTGIGQTRHVDRVEYVVAPARDLFAAVFFFSIGLTTDVTVLSGVAALVGVAAAVTTASKLLTGVLSGGIYGLDRRRSLRLGIGLVPRGEFSLVLAALGVGLGGRLATVLPAFTVGYVLVMSTLGPLLIQRADAVTDVLGRLTDRPG